MYGDIISKKSIQKINMKGSYYSCVIQCTICSRENTEQSKIAVEPIMSSTYIINV